MKIFEGINVVSLSVRDLEEARRFCREVLGFGAPLHDLPEVDWVEFATTGGGGNLAVTKALPCRMPNTSTIVVLNVDDCHSLQLCSPA